MDEDIPPPFDLPAARVVMWTDTARELTVNLQSMLARVDEVIE